jgi:hypothetical protein
VNAIASITSREALIPELACGRQSKLLRQSVMLAQIFSVCGNLFREKFLAAHSQARRKVSVK